MSVHTERNDMDIDLEAVRPILERIAVRGEDDGEKFTNTARVDAIADCLKESSWKLYHDGDLAKIYTRCDFNPAKPVVVVSSHVDMVARRCYVKCDGELWKGSFDNLITNAVIVACIKENAFNGNVMVAFTGDEEADDGFGGADEVAETLSEKGISVKHVVVTDMTEEGWDDKKAFTIENVLPEDDESRQQKMAKSLKEAVAGIDDNPCVIVDGKPDEAWEYDEYDLPCCSVCMPCKGEMHSEEGVEIRGAGIKAYAEAIVAVIRESRKEWFMSNTVLKAEATINLYGVCNYEDVDEIRRRIEEDESVVEWLYRCSLPEGFKRRFIGQCRIIVETEDGEEDVIRMCSCLDENVDCWPEDDESRLDLSRVHIEKSGAPPWPFENAVGCGEEKGVPLEYSMPVHNTWGSLGIKGEFDPQKLMMVVKDGFLDSVKYAGKILISASGDGFGLEEACITEFRYIDGDELVKGEQWL